jgi:alkanesulfonate monooxygenase SsuD/methylene tetrahydromethanopterin reductase-like flavin-dependent oxidoreductase (luciferase family)
MNLDLKVGTTIDMVGPSDSIREGLLAEKLGFDSLWFTDHFIDTGGFKVEPWSTMGAIAVQTKRIRLGTAVTDTQRAHPARTTHSVATLYLMSGGRITLGIGAGEAMNLLPFGLSFDEPQVRTERLAEAVQLIRLLWSSTRNHPANFDGRYFKLRNAWLDLKMPANPLPIFIGALGGRRTLEVVGKFADGWISWVNTPETFKKRLEIAKNSALNVGRDPKSLEAVAWVLVLIGDSTNDFEYAMTYSKVALLSEVHTLKLIGFKMPEELQTPYQEMLASDEMDKRILQFKDAVPDEVAEKFIATGKPDKIAEQINRFQEAGATQVVVEFMRRDEEQMRSFSEKVLPLLRQ